MEEDRTYTESWERDRGEKNRARLAAEGQEDPLYTRGRR